MNHYNKNVSDNFIIHVFRNVLSESYYIYLFEIEFLSHYIISICK